MKRFGEARHRKSGLDITSLIDVVFILLVFFIIGSSFDVPAIPIDLPAATTGEVVDRRTVNVAIDAEGALYLDGRVLSIRTLPYRLGPIVAAEPSIVASLEADGSVPFSVVTEVLDALKRAGLRHVAVRHEVRR